MFPNITKPAVSVLKILFPSDTNTAFFSFRISISFSDILDKTYKIFPNDVFYTQKNVGYVNDFFSRIVDSQKEIITYEQNNLNDLYFDNAKGIELKITGISVTTT